MKTLFLSSIFIAVSYHEIHKFMKRLNVVDRALKLVNTMSKNVSIKNHHFDRLHERYDDFLKDCEEMTKLSKDETNLKKLKQKYDDLVSIFECVICKEDKMYRIVFPNCTHFCCVRCYSNLILFDQSCHLCRKSIKSINQSI